MTHDRTDPARWPPPVARALDAAAEVMVVPSFTRLGPLLRRRAFGWDDAPPDSLAGRRVLVTGATSGIGAATAAGMADLGATVHVTGRDPDKLERTVADLRARGAEGTVVPHLADLTHLDQVAALADEVSGTGGRLDVLAHVAGALVHELTITDDGHEVTFQVHVLAPFLLTMRLLPLLARSAGRVLTMSSGGMYTRGLDLDALVDPPEEFDGTVAYARAKRAQVELNAEWARRHADLGIAFHAMHPGWVDTPGLDAGLPAFARRMRPLLRSPEQGADTAVWLSWSTDVDAPGGDFWLDRRRRHTVALPWTRSTRRAVADLWDAVAARAPTSAPSAGGDQDAAT